MTSRKSKSKNIDNECGIEEDECNKRGLKYKKEDIINIAEKCGVNIYKKNSKGVNILKSVKELCKDIVDHENNKQKFTDVEIIIEEPDVILPIEKPSIDDLDIPICGGKKSNCKKYFNKNNRDELEKLAKKCGVPFLKENGKPRTINDICNDISEITDLISQSNVEPEIIVEEPEIIVDEPEIIIEEDQESWSKADLQAKKLIELKEIAVTLKIKKSQKKEDLIDAILVKTKPQIKKKELKKDVDVIVRKPKLKTITDVIRQKRDILSNILKIKTADYCDPVKNINCNDDNICDIDKNFCISPQEAQYKENKGKVESYEYNDQKIIGKKASIENFKDRIENIKEELKGISENKDIDEIPVLKIESKTKTKKMPVTKKTMCQICTFVNDPGSLECEICQSDLSDEEIKANYGFPENTEIEDDFEDKVLEEGTEIADIENIEDILKEIQNKENPIINNIEGLDEAKKKILMCLGLLS